VLGVVAILMGMEAFPATALGVIITRQSGAAYDSKSPLQFAGKILITGLGGHEPAC